MRITVSLDTQAVITQPSPLRFKAGCFNPIEIAFTRGSQSVPLPDGAVIEFALKPRNQWTGGLLAYLNTFAPGAGSLYTGSLNCATVAILGALGLSDDVPANDAANLDASAEVTWSFSGQKFRSATFSVTVETPLTDDSPVATPDPELYPTPAELALKSDLPHVPAFGTAALRDAGTPNGVATLGPDGKISPEQMSPVPVEVELVPASNAAGRFALTPAQVNIGDLIEQADTHAIYEVIDKEWLNNETGYVQIGIRAAAPVSGLPNGLLAYWKLDEESGVRVDATGNGNDLSDTNAVGFDLGKFGNAAGFDGTNSLTAASPIIAGDANFTIAAWINPSEFNSYNIVASSFPLVSFGLNDGYLHFYAGGPSDCNGDAVTVNEWSFVVFRRQGNSCFGSVNAGTVMITEATDTEAPANFTIGQEANREGYFQGLIDEMGVWNRALSDAEITQLYNNGNGISYPFA